MHDTLACNLYHWCNVSAPHAIRGQSSHIRSSHNIRSENRHYTFHPLMTENSHDTLQAQNNTTTTYPQRTVINPPEDSQNQHDTRRQASCHQRTVINPPEDSHDATRGQTTVSMQPEDSHHATRGQ